MENQQTFKSMTIILNLNWSVCNGLRLDSADLRHIYFISVLNVYDVEGYNGFFIPEKASLKTKAKSFMHNLFSNVKPDTFSDFWKFILPQITGCTRGQLSTCTTIDFWYDEKIRHYILTSGVIY